MARPLDLNARTDRAVVLRLADPEIREMRETVFSRYPNREWATFAWFGWRETTRGLVLTLAAVEPPTKGDLNPDVPHVAIDEQYSLRIALAAEKNSLAPGVVHSHPAGCAPIASTIDDDMDGYYGKYFESFAPGRPYVSLIFSEENGRFVASGRVRWRSEWFAITSVTQNAQTVDSWTRGARPKALRGSRERTARLNAAFGTAAAERLRRSTVAVIGAGGTGSAAIEVLARAGVGRLILVDPDVVEYSNLERIHGSTEASADSRMAKVALARDHVQSIDPACQVTAIRGSLPQEEVVDAVVEADALISCTDSQSSRLAVSDLSIRYLLPALDCAVALEGSNGRVTGQVMQFVRFMPIDPCALCRQMTSPTRVTQELMSPEEIARRRAAADAARQDEHGVPGAYWHDVPQLNTVGYLTTAAGAMAAGYLIGWLTGRFDPPFSRVQMNLQSPGFDVVDWDATPMDDCSCRRVRGWADQAAADAYVSTPAHWPAPIVL